MSGSYQLTDLADQDVMEITLYLARQGGITVAERFMESIGQKFALLAATPGMGRTREELAPGLRSFVHTQYVVFYRVAGEGIQIIRVLHGSRDLESVFPPDEAQ